MAIPGNIIASVTNTLNSVMIAMDSDDDGSNFAAHFTDDASIEVVLTGKTFRGAGEIAGFARFVHAKYPTAKHWEGNIALSSWASESVPQSVRNKSYWQALEGGSSVSMGLHDDFLVAEKDLAGTWFWKIQKRLIVHTWTKDKGDIQGASFLPS